MSGYLVRVLDGPAAGWEYVTLIEPDPVIAIAPHPTRDDFMRVLVDDDTPWPDARRYVRTFDYPVEIAAPLHVDAVPVTDQGEQMCIYRVVNQVQLRPLCEEESGFIVSSSCITAFFPDRAAADFYAEWSARYTEEEMIVCEIQEGGGLQEVARYTPEATP